MAEQDPRIEVDAAEPLESEAPSAPEKARRRWGKLALMALVPLLVAVGALVYNRADTTLPDLLICRPEWAEKVIAAAS